VDAVILLTDAEVDDIRVTFTSSWIADVQAKRNLRKGQIFEKAVARWTEAGRAGVDPDRHRFAVSFMRADRDRFGSALGWARTPTPAQQSNTDQQMSFRNRSSSSTSSRIASGSWSRCHRHSSRPAASLSPSDAAARAALIA